MNQKHTVLDPQRIADLALHGAVQISRGVSPVQCLHADATELELSVAKKAAKYLLHMRSKGYAKEQCRIGFWNKIRSEIDRAADKR